VENVNELCERIIRAAMCVTVELLANIRWETECCLDVCYAVNGAHIEIYWTCKKFCDVLHLKIYNFLHYTLWLKIYVLFCYHLRLDILC
jgi:hypothetical protein